MHCEFLDCPINCWSSAVAELGSSINTCMRLHEIIKSMKPKSPEQMRLAALKTAADQASAAVSAERQRQRLTQANKNMSQLKRST